MANRRVHHIRSGDTLPAGTLREGDVIEIGTATEGNLRRLADVYERLAAEADEARLHLAEAIRVAATDGMRQVDIVKATGYTREQVRRIVAGRTR